MPQKALIYGWIVVAIGIGTALGAALSWRTTNNFAFVVCLALAVLASTFKLKLPGLTGTMSPSFVFVLVAVGQLSWSETIVISAISALVQSIWKAKKRPSGLQLWFNAATLAIAGGLSHSVAHGLVLPGEGMNHVLFLAVAGMVLFIINTLLVSAILCLLNASSLQKVWQSVQTWSVPYYVAGGVLSSVWSLSELTARASVAIMAAISVYILTNCYRGLLGQNMQIEKEEAT